MWTIFRIFVQWGCINWPFLFPPYAYTVTPFTKTLAPFLLNPSIFASPYFSKKKMEPQDVKSIQVLILDFGSQYTHLITRRIRGLEVFSLCLNGTTSLKSITDLSPKVIILSGGPHSVHAPDAPCFPPGFIEYVESNRVAVLGICYGLQLIVQQLGGEVTVGKKQEYGRMEIEVVAGGGLFGNKSVGDRQSVWMSHGDEAVRLPEGFEVVARSRQGAVAAVANREKRFYGLQYHPEVWFFYPLEV